MTNQIFSKLSPGNYWLTKSMEFNRVQTSGTLWFLKKWIVFYYYVFLKPSLHQNDYENICNHFELFISSLPSRIREEASDFFYTVDIRSRDFITFDQFSSNNHNFANETEKKQFLNSAKRYYFMYLMNCGGQAGWKRRIKEKILETKNYQETKQQIEREMDEEGNHQSTIRTQLSDYPASIRNERQIFFYYGFFHGSNQANLDGFYNLTRVGKSIIHANFDELVIIWEHQKIKMISQSPFSEIENLPSDYNQPFFSINLHPYRDLLFSIKVLESISMDEYQFGISRSKITLPVEEMIEFLKINRDNIESLKRTVNTFNRRADVVDFDFRKELLKYILGISNLSKDRRLNPYAMLNYLDREVLSILDVAKLEHTIKVFNHICNYLDHRYFEEYQYFIEKTSANYQSFLHSIDIDFDPTSHYKWPKYIINFDDNVIVYLIYWSISLLNQNYSLDLNKEEIESKFENYKNLLLGFSIKKREFVTLVLKAQSYLFESKIDSLILDDENEYDFIPDDPQLMEVNITLQQIEDVSDQNVSNDLIISGNRNRNVKLIQLLKSYYSRNFSESRSNYIKCDCCDQITFLTYKNTAYLEFHHLIPFNQVFGPDHYLNLFFICPTCHRKLHLSKPENRRELYEYLSQNNKLEKRLAERIQVLYNKGYLEALHLDFLLSEGIISKERYDEYLSEQRVGV